MWDTIEKIFLYKSIEKKLNINFIFNDSCDIEIVSDEKKLKQIYINVIGNAVKFTEKGDVTITTSIVEADNGRVKIETIVKDSGMGMPESFRNSIFKRFERAENNVCKKEGSGLGLAISKELAMLAGGDIEIVESIVGKGSVFKIYFYAEKVTNKSREAEQQKRKNYNKIRKEGDIRALIVDDSKESRKILKEILNDTGIKCEEASNGKEGLIKCKKEEFDIVFTDIVMPEKDGIALINELRNIENYSEKLIIAFTASVYKEQIEVILEAGADEVLIKPVDEKKVVKMIEKYFEIEFKKYKKTEEIGSFEKNDNLTVPQNIIFSIRESLINGDIDEILRICSENSQKYGIMEEISKLARDYNFEKIYEIIENN